LLPGFISPPVPWILAQLISFWNISFSPLCVVKTLLGGGRFHGWKENGSEAPAKISLAEAKGTGK